MAVLVELINSPYLVQGICVALVAIFISTFWGDLADEIPYFRVPLVGKEWWNLSNKKAKSRFTQSARELIAEGFAKVGKILLSISCFTKLLIENRAKVSSSLWGVFAH